MSQSVDVAISSDYRKAEKIYGPCERSEKVWNIKVTVLPIIIAALAKFTRG